MHLTGFINLFFDKTKTAEEKSERGENIFLGFFNKDYEKNLITAFIKPYNKIVEIILDEKINEQNTSLIYFDFVRRISDCIYNIDTSGFTTNVYFNKRLSNIFTNSRRLLWNILYYIKFNCLKFI